MAWFYKWPYSKYDPVNLAWILEKVKTLESQVANVVEIAENWDEQVDALNKRMARIEEENNILKDLYENFTKDIIEQFNDLETRQIEQFNILVESINNRFISLETDINRALRQFNDRLDYLDNKLDDALNNLPNYIIMTDPYTGQPNNLANIINEIASSQRTNALTSLEYDNLDLTALEYDNYEITAYQYDWDAKNLLGQ